MWDQTSNRQKFIGTTYPTTPLNAKPWLRPQDSSPQQDEARVLLLASGFYW